MQSVIISGRDPNTGKPSVVEVVDGAIQVQASSVWTVRFENDETLNDSDKQFVVPVGTVWQVLAIRVELTTDATVGNRQLVIQVLDHTADIQWGVRVGLVQAASLTYYYNFGPSMGDLTAVRDTDWVCTPIPPGLILPAASRLRVFDKNAVSAAGDDMIVHILLGERAE